MPIDILEQKHYTKDEKIRGLRFHIIHQTLIVARAKRIGASDIQFSAGVRRDIAISATNQLKSTGKLR